MNKLEPVKQHAKYLGQENGSRSRLVVITQGSDPVIAVEHGKLHSFPVAAIPKVVSFPARV